MSPLYLDTALRLPAPDVEALIQGQTIAAMPRIFIDQVRVFALYPADVSTNSLPIEQQYRSNFLPLAKDAIAQLNSDTVTLKAWVRCERCQVLDKSEPLENLSRLTLWTTEALEKILSQRPYIFLAYLRVYLLPEKLKLPGNTSGNFVGINPAQTVTENSPVLSDRTFAQRLHQLENRLPPLHPELEELQSAIAQLNNPAAKELDRDIQIFLGWGEAATKTKLNSDLDWIETIVTLGDRSQELDEKKSNYQAGTDFENIVRDSLQFLGFTVDEAYKGGAGGLDLFCSKPYPLVGECKAGKKITSRSPEELIKLGGMRLKEEQFQNATKLIIGPGQPSTDVLTAAQKFRISIINPMSLQNLVELQAKYPGSVNLIELKKYLEPGQIDEKIDEYIQKVLQDIQLRSQIVKAVKELAEQDNENLDPTQKHFIVTEIRVHYNATHNPKLTDELVHDLLVELSSPLTGYLGRKKGSDWKSDRFYFLRDLPIDS